MAKVRIKNLDDCYSGDDYLHTFTFTSPVAPHDPEDLSGRTWLAQWRPAVGHATVVAFTVDDSDAVNGVVSIALTAEQTATLLRHGHYDVQSTTAGGTTRTLVKGSFETDFDVSRAT